MISNVFKMIFNYVEPFPRKSLFYICFVENSLPIVKKLNKINTEKRVKSILTFDFTTLYMTIPYDFKTKVLPEVMSFFFKSKTRSRLGFTKASIYWTLKSCAKRYIARQTSIDAILFLFTKCCFTIS